MNGIVVTGASDEYRELEAITLPNKRAYCERHGYELVTMPFGPHGEGADWGRIYKVYRLLCATTAPFVAWLDCDAIITNADFSLKDIANGASVVLASDIHGVNSGVFVAANNDEAKLYFYAVLGMGPKYFTGWAADQRALEHFIPYYESAWVMGQRWMNSYRYRESCSDVPVIPESGEWQAGDFMLHLAGVKLPRKIEIAREVLGGFESAQTAHVHHIGCVPITGANVGQNCLAGVAFGPDWDWFK